MSIPRLELANITKRYPSVVANDGVSLTVQPGQTHAVLGENGAGKSTLMKIIYGAVKPDEGSVVFDGQPVHIRNPQEARALGISMVFQHFSLFDTLTVAQNVWLGLDRSLTLQQVVQSITAKAQEYGLDVDPGRPVHTLSVGEMQRVEIIRALLTNPKLLILDEPTSVLTPRAVDKLFVVLRTLASQGCSILYISHKLHEIRELCTACTVMRGGKVTGVCDPRQETNASLSRMMIGAEPPALEHHDRTPGDVVLQVQDLSLPREDQFGVDLDGVSLQVRAGEVVGIAGVSGNGQRELMYALSGEDTRAPARLPENYGTPAYPLESMVATALGITTPIATATAPFPSETHNFHFTTEIKILFRYDTNQSVRLEFTGDDDVWVFVNGKLAVDLGGWHPPFDGAVSIEWEDNDAEQHAGARTALLNCRKADNPPSGMRHDAMLKA